MAKPLDAFHRDTGKPRGRRYRCKKCATLAAKVAYAANRDAILAGIKAYQAAHRAEIAAQHRGRRAALRASGPVIARAEKRCVDCHATLPIDAFAMDRNQADWRQARCRACSRIKSAAWRAAHPEQRRKNRAEWAAQHPDRMLAFRRADYAAHKADYIARARQRRARKAKAAGCYTSADLAARWAMWGGRCWVCGGAATATDHVIALARGGSNWPANLRPICTACNSRKHDRDWREFVARKAVA